MKCKDNHEFVSPLMLFNGDYACPICGLSLKLSPTTSLKVTSDNDELFKQSEVIYYNALKKATDPMEFNKLIRKAFDLCREAALDLNPYAICKMGYYYDKDYIEVTSLTEAQRTKIAMDYYSLVINSDDDDYLEAKYMARIYCYDMLAQKSPKERAPYKKMYDKLAKIIDNTQNYFSNNYDDLSSDYFDKSNKDKLFDTLKQFSREDRKPIFGLFKMSNDDIKEVTNDCRKTKGSFWAVALEDGRIKAKGDPFDSLEKTNSQENVLIFLNKKHLKVSKFVKKNRQKVKKFENYLVDAFDSPRVAKLDYVQDLTDFLNNAIEKEDVLVFTEDDIVKFLLDSDDKKITLSAFGEKLEL